MSAGAQECYRHSGGRLKDHRASKLRYPSPNGISMPLASYNILMSAYWFYQYGKITWPVIESGSDLGDRVEMPSHLNGDYLFLICLQSQINLVNGLNIVKGAIIRNYQYFLINF